MERRSLAFRRAQIKIENGDDMINLPCAGLHSAILPVHLGLKLFFYVVDQGYLIAAQQIK